MIRRPLVWLLVTYVTGSLHYRFPFLGIVVFAVILALFVFGYWLYYSRNFHDSFLFAIPFVFLMGYLLMWNQQLPGPIDIALQEGPLYTTCEGRVIDILQKEDSYQLLITDVSYSKSLLQPSSPPYDTKSSIYVYISDIPDLSIGNYIRISGKLSLFTSPTNPGQFNERLYYKLQNIDYRMIATELQVTDRKVDCIKEAFYSLRNRMKRVYGALDEKTASVLNAMLLGDTKNLDSKSKELYQAAGISHVISISGMHITLLGMAIFSLVLRFFGRTWATVAAVVFIVFYGILTGFSVSTNRAVVMMVVFLGAKIVGRTYDLLSAVALSALFILVQEPMQIYNSGFLLSYGAILGIGVSYPCLMSLFPLEEWRKRGETIRLSIASGGVRSCHKAWTLVKCKSASLLGFQFAIQIILLPLLLISYYRISTYACIMNLLVVPCMDYLILFGLPAGLLGCFHLALGRFFLASSYYILSFSDTLCGIVYHLPYHYLVIGQPDMLEIILYCCLVIVGLWLTNKRKKLGLFCLVCGMGILLLPFPKERQLVITALDVGQGDCLVMETPEDSVYMIDGGSSDVSQVGKYRILPFMYAKGIDQVDYVFVSHCDSDHVSGICDLMEACEKGEFTIKHLVVADTSKEDENYKALVEAAEKIGITVMKLKRGDRLKEGELKIECIHPTYEYNTESANDASLVLSLTYGEFDMLFSGDVEAEGEEFMLDAMENKKYEVLKVAHHGSKNSTSEEFLEKTKPGVALISCSKNNRYGHPHKEVLDRLDEVDSQVEITYENGAITIKTDGSSMVIDTYKE